MKSLLVYLQVSNMWCPLGLVFLVHSHREKTENPKCYHNVTQILERCDLGALGIQRCLPGVTEAFAEEVAPKGVNL
jgi:hypothetical protein